jgi:hypothetical protein
MRNSIRTIAPFSDIPFSILFLKFFANAGTLNKNTGFISRMFSGTLRNASTADFPPSTAANEAPL